MTLTTAELTQMRSDIEGLLPDTCNILSTTRTSDNQGGWTTTAGTASAGVACRLDNISGQETLSSGAVHAYTKWMLTLPHDTTISADSKVEIGADTYAVKSFDSGKSWALNIRVEVEKI